MNKKYLFSYQRQDEWNYLPSDLIRASRKQEFVGIICWRRNWILVLLRHLASVIWIFNQQRLSFLKTIRVQYWNTDKRFNAFIVTFLLSLSCEGSSRSSYHGDVCFFKHSYLFMTLNFQFSFQFFCKFIIFCSINLLLNHLKSYLNSKTKPQLRHRFVKENWNESSFSFREKSCNRYVKEKYTRVTNEGDQKRMKMLYRWKLVLTTKRKPFAKRFKLNLNGT